jgi:hypothetical protein
MPLTVLVVQLTISMMKTLSTFKDGMDTGSIS